MLLFKYLGLAAAGKVLSGGGHVNIRFGLPKTYNDPYELFLQTDGALESGGLRAFYEHMLGKIPQLPVTCFSRVPDCIPMWAHYAREHSSICLGFDEDELTNRFPVAYIGDVEYSDEPARISSSPLEYAYTTGKARHARRLLAIAHKAAYFTKRTQWQYERERRLVVAPTDVTEIDSLLISDVGAECLRYIIVGPNADTPLRELCEERANELGTPLYELRHGRRTYEPFFVEQSGAGAVQWTGDEFSPIAVLCPACKEPGTDSGTGKCTWCRIDAETRNDAASRNMLSLMLMTGLEELEISFEGLEPKGWKSSQEEPSPLSDDIAPA